VVNLAVLGIGYWGPNLLRNFSQIDGVTVVTVCDTDTSRLAYMHQRYPQPNRGLHRSAG
jgi:predicted dehydrogenase